MPFMPSENDTYPYPSKRTQFPIRPCFAMTINKAQGQTRDFVRIYLPEPVFSDGRDDGYTIQRMLFIKKFYIWHQLKILYTVLRFVVLCFSCFVLDLLDLLNY